MKKRLTREAVYAKLRGGNRLTPAGRLGFAVARARIDLVAVASLLGCGRATIYRWLLHDVPPIRAHLEKIDDLALMLERGIEIGALPAMKGVDIIPILANAQKELADPTFRNMLIHRVFSIRQ